MINGAGGGQANITTLLGYFWSVKECIRLIVHFSMAKSSLMKLRLLSLYLKNDCIQDE